MDTVKDRKIHVAWRAIVSCIVQNFDCNSAYNMF